MIIKYTVAILLAVIAVIMNFKAKFISEKILKKGAENDIVLKIKILAAVIAILDFALVMILF